MLNSFIDGLKTIAKAFVIAFKPENVAEAIEYARLYKEPLNKSQKSLKIHFSAKPSSFAPYNPNLYKPPIFRAP